MCSMMLCIDGSRRLIRASPRPPHCRTVLTLCTNNLCSSSKSPPAVLHPCDVRGSHECFEEDGPPHCIPSIQMDPYRGRLDANRGASQPSRYKPLPPPHQDVPGRESSASRRQTAVLKLRNVYRFGRRGVQMIASPLECVTVFHIHPLNGCYVRE